MADRDPIQPIHEPTLAVVDEESSWVQDAADRFENASAPDLLAWAIETFHPRLAISAAGGVDGRYTPRPSRVNCAPSSRSHPSRRRRSHPGSSAPP